jgi:hypothetical protein
MPIKDPGHLPRVLCARSLVFIRPVHVALLLATHTHQGSWPRTCARSLGWSNLVHVARPLHAHIGSKGPGHVPVLAASSGAALSTSLFPCTHTRRQQGSWPRTWARSLGCSSHVHVALPLHTHIGSKGPGHVPVLAALGGATLLMPFFACTRIGSKDLGHVPVLAALRAAPGSTSPFTCTGVHMKDPRAMIRRPACSQPWVQQPGPRRPSPQHAYASPGHVPALHAAALLTSSFVCTCLHGTWPRTT